MHTDNLSTYVFSIEHIVIKWFVCVYSCLSAVLNVGYSVLPDSFWNKVSCECDFPLYSDSFWNKMEVPLGGHLPERRIPDAKGVKIYGVL
jgi:hypothetical protein